MHPSLFRGWSHAISFKCRIGDQPVVHPVHPAIHHVREQKTEDSDQKMSPELPNCLTVVPSRTIALSDPCVLASVLQRALGAAGGASRDRTGDLKLAKLALSQLSYGPGYIKSDQVVGPGRVERPTSRLSGVRSNHLSYEPKCEMRSGLDAQSREPTIARAFAHDHRRKEGKRRGRQSCRFRKSETEIRSRRDSACSASFV
jgi:hypothetical protein